jgi:peroxiredoxin
MNTYKNDIMRKFCMLVLTGLLMSSVYAVAQLQQGIWRGQLKVTDKQAPFLFEVSKPTTNKLVVTLINGQERVDLSGVKLQNDTITIPIDIYDATIKGIVKGDKIEGLFIKNYIEKDPGVAFSAFYNKKNRFDLTEKPLTTGIEGKWDVLFIDEKGDTTRNVGIFQSDKGIITGSVLTSSGDLRFLEGAYTDNGAQLSAFSGLSPYLIELSLKNNQTFEGTFYTTRGKTRLVGNKNDKAGLSDPYSIARLKAGKQTLGFSLPNLDGKNVSLRDERYRGKVVIVSILGSWCPNCLDETSYLAPWYEANKHRGIEIIGLGFERKDDPAYAKGTLTRLKNKYNIGYEILFAGKANAETIARVFPEIEGFGGYPTTFFIDKKGNVRKIHTGYNGPATGLFYEEFKAEFNTLIDKLVSENQD